MDAQHGNPIPTENAASEHGASQGGGHHDEMLMRVGHMTRTLHDSLRGLGFDKLIQKAAQQEIPDARDRLDYVAKMTEQAAQRVLNATDAASPLQDGIDDGASMLAEGWQVALDGPFSEKQYRILADRTMFYLTQSRASAQGTKQQQKNNKKTQKNQNKTKQKNKQETKQTHNLEQ